MGITFAASGPAEAATYNYKVWCSTSYFGSGCKTPVLSVNIRNLAGVRNAVLVNLTGGSWDACTWYLINHKTGTTTWHVRVGENKTYRHVLYGLRSTYVLKTKFCMGGYGSAQDY